MSIDIRGLRLSLERHLEQWLKTREIRVLRSGEYRVTGGRARVRLTEDQRFEIVLAFNANRTSNRMYVRDIELAVQSAATAEVIRFLLGVRIGVEFTVTAAAFFGSVRTVQHLTPVIPDGWR